MDSQRAQAEQTDERDGESGAGLIRRRTFLGVAAAAAAALLSPFRLGGQRDLGAALESFAAARKRDPFGTKLPLPKTIRGGKIKLTIRTAKVRILPGPKTKMWTYGGSFPGPTIRRPAGTPTTVTFKHKLPRRAGELSVHLHGGHTRSVDDGQPGGLTKSHASSYYCAIDPRLTAAESGNKLLLEPGKSRAYRYDLIEDEGPERSAFQWYHDHRLDHTARNVWKGLAGMFIIDDAFDASLPLPDGARDIPLMFVERTLDKNNQLTNPFAQNRRPPNDGVVGRYALVNGALRPHLGVQACRYRLRLLNASHFRAFNFALSDGGPLIQVASDSGLMPVPVPRTEILLGPAERAEVIVDFTGKAGQRIELRSVPRSDGHTEAGTRPRVGSLMQFRVGSPAADPSSVPPALRALPDWVSGAAPDPDRNWVITISGGFRPRWLLNGKTFNPNRSDAFPALDTTETWRITNGSGVAHVIHMHGTDWYMLARNGQPPPAWEDCLKESFFILPGESITVAAHFTNFTGRYVIHCHMLDHEDHGLMSQYEVVATAADQPRADEVARRARGEIPGYRGARYLGLPARALGSAVEFKPRAPGGEQLERLEVLVDGKTLESRAGDATADPVRVQLSEKGPGRVTLIGRTPDGRQVAAARDYRRGA